MFPKIYQQCTLLDALCLGSPLKGKKTKRGHTNALDRNTTPPPLPKKNHKTQRRVSEFVQMSWGSAGGQRGVGRLRLSKPATSPLARLLSPLRRRPGGGWRRGSPITASTNQGLESRCVCVFYVKGYESPLRQILSPDKC